MKMTLYHLLTIVLTFLMTHEVTGYELTIIHTNDVHARIQQFNKYGTPCSTEAAAAGECFGGVARRMTKVRELRQSHPNTVFLDAGDQFLGTLWYTYYKGREASHFMNLLGYDVMCLGNHEFDDGPSALARFLDNVTFSVVSSNTAVTLEPALTGKFQRSTVINVGGENIGIVGYITPDTAFISNGGENVVFSDVIVSVTEEVNNLTSQGINKIIALGHAGFPTDLLVAQIDGVDVVVGGHTNTFLYNGAPPSNDDIDGRYPQVVTQASGKTALVVQDFTMAKYLGYLNVTFDDNGDVIDHSGNPIVLNSSVEEDATMLQYVNEWAQPLNDLQDEVVGYSKLTIDGTRQNCRVRECLMGNLMTDAMIDYHINFTHSNVSWTPAAIAVWNGGGIRASIGKGSVTRGEILTTLPFGNQVDLIRVTGSNLRAQLNHAISAWDPVDPSGRFLQVSGIKVTYLTDEKSVYDVEVRCLECESPSYSPLKDDEEYNLFVSDFIIRGGDGFSFEPIKRERFNSIDSTVLTEYFKKHNPTYTELSGRIVLKTRSEVSGATTPVMSIAQVVLLLCITFYNYVPDYI